MKRMGEDKAQPDTLAQSFSDGLIAVLMNNVVAYNEEDRIKYLQRIREHAKYETVASYYAYLANQDAEQKKESMGVIMSRYDIATYRTRRKENSCKLDGKVAAVCGFIRSLRLFLSYRVHSMGG